MNSREDDIRVRMILWYLKSRKPTNDNDVTFYLRSAMKSTMPPRRGGWEHADAPPFDL